MYTSNRSEVVYKLHQGYNAEVKGDFNMLFMYSLIEFKVKKKPVCCISFFQKKNRMNLTTSDVQSDEYYNHLYILCLTSLSRDHCGCAFSTS